MEKRAAGSLEFRCLDAMRAARAIFFDDIVAHARRHQAEAVRNGASPRNVAVATLRSENAYQIAEFYYLAEEFGLASPLTIGEFINNHNRDMQILLEDTERLALYGVRKERIAEAIFSQEEKAKVVENTVVGRLRLDQSDVGRCLATLISPETCRKTLVALGDGGLLERKKVGSVIVTSTGILEAYFRNHLRMIAESLA